MPPGRIAGLTFVVCGLAINIWTLEAFIAGDGYLASRLVKLLIAAAELTAIAAGVWLWRTPARLRQPSLAQCGLLILSATLAIGLAEAAGRFRQSPSGNPGAAMSMRDGPPPAHLERAEPAGWRMVPNHRFEWTVDRVVSTYAANAQGFRSPHDFSKLASPRIGLVGDSLTSGLGVDYDQTFGALVERRLSGGRVDNFAMPGFGIDQLWLSVRGQVLPLGPTYVIVAFTDTMFARTLTPPYRGDEPLVRPRLVIDDGRLRPLAAADLASGPAGWLRRHSALWRFLDDAAAGLRPFGEWWALNTALFEAMAADCRERDVPVLFVRLPQRDVGPFPSLAGYMRRHGFDYLDLGLDGLTGDLHYSAGFQLNARGHEHVAAAVVSRMAEARPAWMRAR